ncbi:MAG: family 43 glycosylhydrolase [Clostridia bacterium]|nr:family 43 glycosylhydrolase [Clostridia bacterium]
MPEVRKIAERPFIAQRADPYILRHKNGKYYFTASVPEYDRIVIRQSDTLEGLRTAPEVEVWHKHDSGVMSVHIWAPELHYLDGAWYIYFAAGNVDDIWAIRPYVLRCAQTDPLTGDWEEMGMLRRADDFCFNDFSLDMTVFEHLGRRYAVWAEKVNVGKKISNMYIAEMESPTALKTPQMLLSFPSYAWEQVDFWVNEGPAFLAGKDHVYIAYSASATGACYCMGLLTADAKADLLDPNAWRKARQPVLATDEEWGVYGPGHNSFFQNELGETVMAFHARPYAKIVGDPLYDPNRHCCLMKIDWQDDRPVFDYANCLNLE